MKTENGVSWQDFADGRRPARASDYYTAPKSRGYYSLADAVAAMACNDIASRVYEIDQSGRFSIGFLHEYFVLSRKRKGGDWAKSGRSVLATCQADADSAANLAGENEKTVEAGEFWKIQSEQHLRKLGIGRSIK